MVPTRLDPKEVAEQITKLSRQPFAGQVTRLLLGAPSEAAIVALAERSPDRYWQALAIAARLAGYSDKLEMDANVQVRVSQLSDSELLSQLAALKTEQLAVP